MSQTFSDQTIADLGEQGLLALLHSFCPQEVVGDDAALLKPQAGYSVVVTTDVLVDGVHFSDRTTPPHSVGWRAAAANLSDLAAMGAMPLGITVGLSLPSDCSVTWVEQVYQGMQDCLSPHGCSIIGGDVCRSTVRSLAITALGEVTEGFQICRNTAQVGDAIVVTGSHGGSRAGLELLMNGLPDPSSPGQDSMSQELLIKKHRYPLPRLDCIPILNELMGFSSDLNVTISGMDSSDGLADAVLQICRASGVGAVVWAEQIPILPTLLEQVDDQTARQWALYGGEDFELVLTMPQLAAQTFCKRVHGAQIIGEVCPDPGRVIVSSRMNFGLADRERQQSLIPGSEDNHALSLEGGFQHFA